MPSIPIASFLAGSLESLLFPVLLLIGARDLVRGLGQAPVRRRPGRSVQDRPPVTDASQNTAAALGHTPEEKP